MSKITYPQAKGRGTTTVAHPAPRVSPVAAAKAPQAPVIPAKNLATKTPVSTTGPVAETKAPSNKLKRQDRPSCAAVRKELGNTDVITKAADYTGRQGTLRHNIVAAIQSSATVWDAVKKEVNGPGKHETLPYTVKKVDVGFAIANGFITIKAAK